MKTTRRRWILLAAVSALSVGGLAVAAPAVAGADLFGRPAAAPTGPGPGWDDGDAGMGMNGRGINGTGTNGSGMAAGMGGGARDGSCLDPASQAAKGTLTEQQTTTLAAMAQEEKLAHDLYVAFAATYDVAVFDRIAQSETQHLTLVRALLDRHSLADPTAGQPAGQFSDPAVQATYDRLLVQGQASQAAALQVGQTVEQTDIDDLRAAQNGLTAADVRQVYEHLLAASQHHLSAFKNWSTR
jgi:hypothetical protein